MLLGLVQRMSGEARISGDPVGHSEPLRRIGVMVWFLLREGRSSCMERFRSMIAQLRMDPTSFANAYSVPIRIRPTRMRID